MTKILMAVLLFALPVLAENAPGDSVVGSFAGKFSLQFLARYNYASLSGESTGDENFATNRPIDIGLGGGYGDLTWSTLVTVSFGADSKKPKTRATDWDLNYFGDRFFWNLFLKVNDGFYWKDGESGKFRKADLLTVSAGYVIDYIWNGEHSLRAAYSLDRIQKKSNGSFVFGAGVYYHGIVSSDSLLAHYAKYQQFVHLGPNVGYSYTWIWRSGWFFNLLGVASTSLGKNLTRDQWMFFSQVFPKFALGFHAEKWSVHFPFFLNALRISSDDGELSDIFFSASGGFMFTRRF